MPCTPGCLAIVKNVDYVHPEWRNRLVRVERRAYSRDRNEHGVVILVSDNEPMWWISAADGSMLPQPTYKIMRLGFGLVRETQIDVPAKEVFCPDKALIPLTPPGELDEIPAPPAQTPIKTPELTH